MGMVWCVMIGAFYSEHRLYFGPRMHEGRLKTVVLACSGEPF